MKRILENSNIALNPTLSLISQFSSHPTLPILRLPKELQSELVEQCRCVSGIGGYEGYVESTQKYCENCAGIMIQEKARKRYVPKEAATLVCQICGKEFTSTASRKPKYCSDECREEGLRRHYKELWQKQKAEKEKK